MGTAPDITVDDLSTAAGGSLLARQTQIAYGEINASNTLVADNGRFAVQVTNAEGHSEYRQHDGRFGALLRLDGPNGLETFMIYDDFGRQVAEIRADGTQSEIYRADCTANSPCPTNGAFKVMSLETGAPASVVISDRYGREIQAATIGFDGTPVISATRYNSLGQVDEIDKPYLNDDPPISAIVTAFEYDVLGRLVTEIAPGESTGTVTEYLEPGTDSSVSPSIVYHTGIRVTNEKGQTASEYFDVLGRRAPRTVGSRRRFPGRRRSRGSPIGWSGGFARCAIGWEDRPGGRGPVARVAPLPEGVVGQAVDEGGRPARPSKHRSALTQARRIGLC